MERPVQYIYIASYLKKLLYQSLEGRWRMLCWAECLQKAQVNILLCMDKGCPQHLSWNFLQSFVLYWKVMCQAFKFSSFRKAVLRIQSGFGPDPTSQLRPHQIQILPSKIYHPISFLFYSCCRTAFSTPKSINSFSLKNWQKWTFFLLYTSSYELPNPDLRQKLQLQIRQKRSGSSRV